MVLAPETRTSRGWECLPGQLGTEEQQVPQAASQDTQEVGLSSGTLLPDTSLLSPFGSGIEIPRTSPSHHLIPLYVSLAHLRMKGTRESCSFKPIPVQGVAPAPGELCCHISKVRSAPSPPPALEGGPREPRGWWEVGGEKEAVWLAKAPS